MKTIISQIVILAIVVFDCAIAQTTKEADESVDKAFLVVTAPDGKSYFPKGKESYYTQYYRAAKLPSLRDKREPKGHVRFRLAILPSFTKPIFFTYYKDASGAFIDVKRLQLRRVNNGGEPDKVELSGRVAIGKMDAKQLEYYVLCSDVRQTLKKLTERERAMYQGVDGCVWILEVSTDTDYTMSDVWSPEAIGFMDAKTRKELNLPKVDTKSFIEFCDRVLETTDMKVSENGIPDD